MPYAARLTQLQHMLTRVLFFCDDYNCSQTLLFLLSSAVSARRARRCDPHHNGDGATRPRWMDQTTNGSKGPFTTDGSRDRVASRASTSTQPHSNWISINTPRTRTPKTVWRCEECWVFRRFAAASPSTAVVLRMCTSPPCAATSFQNRSRHRRFGCTRRRRQTSSILHDPKYGRRAVRSAVARLAIDNGASRGMFPKNWEMMHVALSGRLQNAGSSTLRTSATVRTTSRDAAML